MVVSDEEVAALRADLERIRREEEAMKADLEKKKRELEESKSKRELRKREYEAWLQSENVEMPMFPLLEGPQQSAPTAVALAAEEPAAEVTTDTRVFPDTAAPDASVERAAIKLTPAAGTSSKICIPVPCFHWRPATTTITATATAAVTAVTATATVTATAAAAVATTTPQLVL